jgi:hypothetical protein
MLKGMMYPIFFLWSAAALAPSLLADVVELKTGERLQGTFKQANAAGVVIVRRASGPSGGAGPHFTDHGGPVIVNAHLLLIFWGTAWTTVTPSIGNVTDAVVNILTGPYMNSLSQYRNTSHGTLFGTTVVTTAIGGSPANPPNPFSDGDIAAGFTGAVDAQTWTVNLDRERAHNCGCCLLNLLLLGAASWCVTKFQNKRKLL